MEFADMTSTQQAVWFALRSGVETRSALCRLLGLGERAVWRALRVLEEAGWAVAVRSQSPLGEDLATAWMGVSPDTQGMSPETSPPVSQDIPQTGIKSDISGGHDFLVSKLVEVEERKPVSVNRNGLTRATRAREGAVMGYSFFDEEKPKPTRRKDKRSARARKPQAEWNCSDMAREVSARISLASPDLVFDMVGCNRSLAAGLKQHRERLGTGPEDELRALEKFLADPANLRLNPKYPAWRRYLASFRDLRSDAVLPVDPLSVDWEAEARAIEEW